MEEIWKQIENYENYSVSTFGKVRNDTTGKILKGCKKSQGNYECHFTKDGIRKYFFIHRLIALAFIPNPEEKLEIDHIDNDPSNNKIENLRWATRQENIWNRRIPSDNKSGIKGVSWCNQTQKWRAQIHVDGITVHLGRYNTIARQTRANQAFGVFTNACETIQF